MAKFNKNKLARNLINEIYKDKQWNTPEILYVESIKEKQCIYASCSIKKFGWYKLESYFISCDKICSDCLSLFGNENLNRYEQQNALVNKKTTYKTVLI